MLEGNRAVTAEPLTSEEFIFLSYHCRRFQNPGIDTWQLSLEVAVAVAREQPYVPPLGWLADATCLLAPSDPQTLPDDSAGRLLPDGLRRAYEDLFYERMIGDENVRWAFRSAASYPPPERIRATAYLLQTLQQKLAYAGPSLSPSGLRRLIRAARPEDAVNWSTTQARATVMHQLVTSYHSLVNSLRSSGRLVGRRVIDELHAGIASASFAQRLLISRAVRRSQQLVEQLDRQSLAAKQNRSRPSPAADITMQDSSQLTSGGYQSIGTRGRIESMLHSELAYMSADTDQRPDLFDVRFIRGETLYFERDDEPVAPPLGRVDIDWQSGLQQLSTLSSANDQSHLDDLLATTNLLCKRLLLNSPETQIRIQVDAVLIQTLHDAVATLERLLRSEIAAGQVQIDRGTGYSSVPDSRPLDAHIGLTLSADSEARQEVDPDVDPSQIDTSTHKKPRLDVLIELDSTLGTNSKSTAAEPRLWHRSSAEPNSAAQPNEFQLRPLLTARHAQSENWPSVITSVLALLLGASIPSSR